MRRIVTIGVIAAVLVAAGGLGTTGPESTADLETVAVATELWAGSDMHVSDVYAASGDVVGAIWDSGHPDHVEVRALQQGEWSEWRELVSDDEHAPDPGTSEAIRTQPGTEPTAFRDAEAVQFRTYGEELGGLEAVFVDIEETSFLPNAAAAQAAVAIQPRSAWDPDNQCVPRETPEEIQVNTAILHHTGIDQWYSQSSVPGMILGYCLYHRNGRGWDDIAYNFLIDEYGTIWEGRAGGIEKGIRGGHTAGFSSYSTGIALIGNYTRAYPTQAQQNALTSLLAWKFRIHNIEPTSSSVVISQGSYKWDEGVPVTLKAISGHRDAQATACPGSYCYSQFDLFRGIVSDAFSAWPTSTYGPFAFGDFDGDGTDDGAAFAYDGSWSVFDGDSGTAASWDDGSSVTFTVATSADLDSNSRDDIVAAANGKVYELVSTGSSFTTTQQSVSGTPMAILRAEAGSGEQTVVVMTNGRVVGGSLTTIGSVPDPVDAEVGDLDGDGTDEVVVLDAGGAVHVVALDGSSGLHGASLGTGVSDRIVMSDFRGTGAATIAAVDMDNGIARLVAKSGSSLKVVDTLDFGTKDHLTEVVADETTDPARLLAVDAFVGQWKAAYFTGPLPGVTILEDQAWRTHVVRGEAITSEPFVAWYGREFGWMQSIAAFDADEDANATLTIAGASRYTTNVEVSRLAYSSADHVVIATSENFPDALTAGAVAAATDSPLLLTATSSLPGTIENELVRLGATSVTIAGGPAAVGEAVVNRLANLGISVQRVGGANRYETAVLLSKATFSTADTVFIATGKNYPDALAGVPAAAARSAPVLLVADSLPTSVQAELARLDPAEIVILGGPVAVPESVAAQIEAATGVVPTRLGGANRYDTAALVSKSTFSSSVDSAFVTHGVGYIDAVLAGPVAAKLGSPLLLTRDEAPGSLRSELARLNLRTIILIGGSLDNEDTIDSFDGLGASLSTETLVYAPRP